MAGGAAAKAGMHDGDRIVKVGDADTMSVTHEAAVTFLQLEMKKPEVRIRLDSKYDLIHVLYLQTLFLWCTRLRSVSFSYSFSSPLPYSVTAAHHHSA